MLKRRVVPKTRAGLGAPPSFAPPANRSFAESFPAKPVRIVTPFPPGAGPDAALRVISDRLSKKWEQPVVVANRPGGTGFIAVAAFKQGTAAAYDLIELDSGHITTHPHLSSTL